MQKFPLMTNRWSKKKKTGTENPDSDFRGIDGQQKGEDVVNA